MDFHRYEVCTWSSDIGTDTRMDFNRFSEAVKDAKRYRRSEEYAAIYDRQTRQAFVIFGDPATPVFNDSVTVHVW